MDQISQTHTDVESQSSTDPSLQESSSENPGNQGSKFACPLCPFSTNNQNILEIHVYQCHEELMDDFKPLLDASSHESAENYYSLMDSDYKSLALDSMRIAFIRGDLTNFEFANLKEHFLAAENEGLDDKLTCSSDVLENIRNILPPATMLATGMDHFATGYGDEGWGCGYRNIQALLSSLLGDPDYREHLTQQGLSEIPSISKLQKLIERAWTLGFDKTGKDQLGGRLIDTCKWIGATEVAALFASLRIRSIIVDCYANPIEGGVRKHPALFKWVKEYFSHPTTFKHPIYLQQRGHSRTIAGITSDHSQLVVLDPSAKLNVEALPPSRILIGHGHFHLPTYQMLVPAGIITSDEELEEYKILMPIRVFS